MYVTWLWVWFIALCFMFCCFDCVFGGLWLIRLFVALWLRFDCVGCCFVGFIVWVLSR